MSTTTTTTTDLPPPSTMTVDDSAEYKLTEFRKQLQEANLDVYIIPTDDPHLSEYTPIAYKRRGFLTNFHGSAGTAVVTDKEALLWTDSRYFNEAGKVLDPNHWTLMKMGSSESVPSIPKWLGELAATFHEKHKRPLRVGLDPFVHPASFETEVEEEFKNNDEIMIGELVPSESNLVDQIWKDRPPLPINAFRVHPLEYAGVSVADKVQKIRKEMSDPKKKATMAIFSTLDDVAYLFNLRAMGDVETCPVGLAYATITHDEVTLYCDSAKVDSPAVKEHLSDVCIRDYGLIIQDIKAHVEKQEKSKVWLDKSRANMALAGAIPSRSLVDAPNAIAAMKACKNDAELEGMRRAHLNDGAAMAEFIAWLEETLQERTVSEVEVDRVLTACRARQPGYIENSFPTIAGVGSNGAIIHYQAKEGTELLKHVDKNQPILIDSGGQYLFGTTDVTRTWHFGSPNAEFVEAHTRVLKGHISLDRLVFPENTPGFVLDAFARKFLWDAHMDYGHGTGHGVGAALNVHEGPISISPRWYNKEPLKAGMIVSCEPGYYEDGNFGTRVENLIFIKEATNGEEDGKKKFFKFEKLTMIPIQKSLIDVRLMTDEELDWLDEYHAQVFANVSPLLEAGTPALAWLEKACYKIDRS